MPNTEPKDQPARRAGRWRTGQESRLRILDAARTLFMTGGYDGTSVRSIAAQAGVDVAMVYYFFGKKESLFAQVLAGAEHPVRLLVPLLDQGLQGIGARLVRTCLEHWDAAGFQPSLALLRAADHLPSIKAAVRDEIQGPVADRLARDFGISDAAIRLELITVQLLGLATARYQLGLPEISAAEPESLVAWIGPTLQGWLTDPSREPDAG